MGVLLNLAPNSLIMPVKAEAGAGATIPLIGEASQLAESSSTGPEEGAKGHNNVWFRVLPGQTRGEATRFSSSLTYVKEASVNDPREWWTQGEDDGCGEGSSAPTPPKIGLGP